MLPPGATIFAALVLVGTRLPAAGAQAPTPCDLATLFSHLHDIQGLCCADGCASSYPGEADECSRECGEIFEPFWDSCGSMLTAMGVGGTEGMFSFYDSCLDTLYPPGQCADECTPSMMHCRTMEVQAACCGDPRNCPAGDPVPHSCPVGCALVFPFFLESCHDALLAQGSDVVLYERFSQVCTRQDTTALVEYAIDLVQQGCTVELDGLRRLAEVGDFKEHVAKNVVADDSRRLQAVGTGACAGFVDDPNGDLAAHGVSCEQVLALGCDSDLSRIQPTMARGSLVKNSCPVSCEECHRKGIAQWIETPDDCPWDMIDDRLEVVNEACCATDGADPDVACPRGAPPRACSAMCAVLFHSLSMDCGDKLLSLAGQANAQRFTAFDELCTSERSVDPMTFLDAIANAECAHSHPPPYGFLPKSPEPHDPSCVYLFGTGQRLVEDDGALKPAIGDPLRSCKDYKRSTDWDEAPTGVYWILTDGQPFKSFCENSIEGGGWTLVLQASSTSNFRYNNNIFTSSVPTGPVGETNPNNNADSISPGYWSVAGQESMLCMGEVVESYCNAWPNQLVHQGPLQTQTASYMVLHSHLSDFNVNSNVGPCQGVMCAPDDNHGYPTNLWNAATHFDQFQPYNRVQPRYGRGIGYLNDEGGRGNIRIGWGGDGDGSDSHDTAIGIGQLRTYESDTVDGGSGYFMYSGWTRY